MSDTFLHAMQEATRLMQNGRMREAGERIRQALGLPDEGPAECPQPPSSHAAAGQSSPSGQVREDIYSCPAGQRSYRLHVPASGHSRSRALVLMLHGCGQDPDGFARATRMDEHAGDYNACVLYPAQDHEANAAGCWNWFRDEDQQRGRGEPAILAGLTRQIIGTHGIDPSRVHVAGFSAGGAMAVVMAVTYPELFAAFGVHSGLPYAAAHDPMSALLVMRQGGEPEPGALAPDIPGIVFHGDHDATVSPLNTAWVLSLAQQRASRAGSVRHPDECLKVGHSRAPGGLSFTRTDYHDSGASEDLEFWMVHGAGHAWSGGDPAEGFTEPRGPDASRAMLEFFEKHRR